MGAGREYQVKYNDSFNKNVEWIDYPYFWWCYLAAIILVWALLYVLEAGDVGACFTITHVAHNLLTFYLFHWVKGSPDEFSQGEFNGLTLFEQLDSGIPWTSTKKLFMLVPTVLCYAASQYTNYDHIYLAINIPVYVFLAMIPKIPSMHRVRVLGINCTPGIDDDDTANPLYKKGM